MWKIIKKSIEKIELDKKKFNLWMKWEFKIEFATDSFWPYNYKYEREDCYFNDWLEDRGTKIFPLKSKDFSNNEIFLENNEIVIAIWERWSLMWEEKSFIDIINIKTEKKYRLFTNYVNLIYNTEKTLIINAFESETKIEKTFKLDLKTLEKISEKKEKLRAFFKLFYNFSEEKWFLLDFFPSYENEKNEEKKYQDWYFKKREMKKIKWIPEKFDRKKFEVKIGKSKIDVWEESKN